MNSGSDYILEVTGFWLGSRAGSVLILVIKLRFTRNRCKVLSLRLKPYFQAERVLLLFVFVISFDVDGFNCTYVSILTVFNNHCVPAPALPLLSCVGNQSSVCRLDSAALVAGSGTIGPRYASALDGLHLPCSGVRGVPTRTSARRIGGCLRRFRLRRGSRACACSG